MIAASAQAPVANFSANTTSGCGPLGVTFRDLSTNAPTFWNWDFGNGQTSTLQNPGVTYGAPGTYTVTLVARNTSGANAIRKTDYITVFPFPSPGFTSNLTLACTPASIQFNDLSTPGQGSITSWSWDLGDGTTSNQQNPSHTYTQTGYYNVSLKVTNSGGCSNTAAASRYLRMVSGIQPAFSSNQISNSCSAPFVMNFINQTAGPGNLTFNWNLGNGAIPASSSDTSPSPITYPAGNFTVTLQVQSSLGCSASIQKPLSFAAGNAVINSPDTACVNTPASFINGSTPPPASSAWDFGDGTGSSLPSNSKTYTVPGPYTVKLVNTYSTCADSITKIVQVVNVPAPAFTATSPLVSCKAPFTVSFADQTTPAPTGWVWDFGDGSTSTQPNPSHTYTTTGLFNVKLTVTSSAGCSNSITKSQYVQIVAPTVGLVASSLQGCINTPIQPIAVVNSVDGILSYAWTATGAAPPTSTAPNPSFTYSAPANSLLSVTVTTNGGCTATAGLNVKIGTMIPGADFTITSSPVCGRDLVTFQTTTPADNWDWSFGDGGSSPLNNVQMVTHSYNDVGNFLATLVLFNNGCQTVVQKNVNVIGSIPGFTSTTPGCTQPFSIQFTDTSHYSLASTPVSWSWDFGDGSPASTVQSPPHVYPNTGPIAQPYNVTLTITAGGCVNAVTIPTLVGPVATSFTSPASACRNVSFLLTSTIPNPALIASYSWQIDANPPTAPSTSPSLNVGIATLGNHTITLYVVDIHGCPGQATNTIVITGPIASFTTTGGCVNSLITFNDQSTPYPGNTPGPPAIPPAPITDWTFIFGDNNLKSLKAPFTYQYADTGIYLVQLIVTDNAGCKDVSAPSFVQITSPQAFFSADTFYCPNIPLPFKDSSQGYGLTYKWDFGDGGTSTQQNPSHPFAGNGQYYNIQLTVTDQTGCSASRTISRYIHIQHPIAAFTIADTTAICTPLQTLFTAQGQFYDSLYWDFGDGSTSTLPNTSHFYNDFGIDTAKLFLRGPGGCLDSASRTVFISNPSNSQFLYGPPTQACDSILVSFQITPPIYTKFQLVFGDSKVDSSGNKTPIHMYRNPSTYFPQLDMQDASGCIVGIGSGSGPITVLGSVPFFSLDKHAFCDSSVVNFTDFTITNDGIVSETYTFGDGSTDGPQATNPFNATHFYNQPGILLATLHVVTNSNCAENYTDTIRVHQTPHPIISTTGLLCTGLIQFQGSLVTPMVTPGMDSVLWAWNFANGQSSKLQDPAVHYQPGTYNVSLRTSVPFGCSDTISKPITIYPLPEIKGPREVSTPVGFPVTLPFTYSSDIVSYSWTPTAWLDCTTCPNPAATPTFNTLYTVSVIDSNNCTSTDSILVKTICNGVNYFLPNTFSPNGDGVNDVFYPRGVSLYNVQSMRIFNRWGQLVFERRNFPANSASDGWDGNFNGRPAPSDAYVYIVEVICNNAQVVALKGDVTLVR